MAKTEIITEDKTITVNPKSKSKVYQYGAEGITLTFDGGFISDKGKEILDYKDNYYNFATKNKDNLVLTTLFTTSSGKAKRVTTTIKNFFLDDTKNYNFEYKTYYPVSPVSEDLQTLAITPNTEYGTNGLYYETGVENDISYMLGSNKNDKDVLLNGQYSNYIYDSKGADEYISRHSNVKDFIWDISGNDEYTVDSYGLETAGLLYTYDYKGNDEYNAKGNSARLYSKDYSGNDEYELESGAEFWIEDYKGNDEYTVDKNMLTADMYNRRINDLKGNDEYQLFNKVNVDIIDQAGKDEYEIKNIDNSESNNHIEITDDGSGKDKYNISNCSDLVYNDFSIADANGSDTYILNNVSFAYNSYESALENGYAIQDENGKDKYSMTDSEYVIIKDINGKENYSILGNSRYIKITDNGGNDTYNLNGYDKKNNTEHYVSCCNIYDNGKSSDVYKMDYTDNVNIYDDGGKNKFNIKNSKYTIIYAENYKDTYNLTNTQSFSIDDNGETVGDTYNIKNSTGYIIDNGGKDSYNFKQSTFSVKDNGSDNDKYKVDTLKIIDKNYNDIDDKGGNKDSLTISNLNKNNIVYMMDYWTGTKSDHYRDTSSTLIIYDKENKGFVKIYNFYKDENHDGVYEGYGDGRIETIKAGKKTLKDIPEYTHFNEIAEQVGAWLDANATPEYGLSVATALTSDKDISGLIQIFQGGNA